VKKSIILNSQKSNNLFQISLIILYKYKKKRLQNQQDRPGKLIDFLEQGRQKFDNPDTGNFFTTSFIF